MKPSALLCPVIGCGQTRRQWQAVCDGCWRLLPGDHRATIRKTRAAGAKHLEARASIAAANWLNEHSPQAQAARRVGDDPP
ncbi:hypothetical protein [Sphingomonas paucimobilis]|uniref:hypothetical protein n=1 Tax=Sphingomonas paucimobilis TaxID=13689 RepID=UPI000AAC05A7|nr:hypothetical protein [Sphingomonas paucimobilis]